MIEIIPAIDLIGGQCVRLTQGDYGRRTTYYKDPLDAARRYEDCGIRRLHLVDLDGAKAAHPVNLNVLERITVSTSAASKTPKPCATYSAAGPPARSAAASPSRSPMRSASGWPNSAPRK